MVFLYRNRTFTIEGVSDRDEIFRTIVNTQCFYERDLLEYMYSIRRFLRRRDSIAIDVGANIGNHSIFLQSFLADDLIAVEPNPTVLPVLKNNLSSNIRNYSVYDCALGEADGSGTIVLPKNAADNSGMARVEPDGVENTVRITTLDSMVTDWGNAHTTGGHISIIKIDVEGMEAAVLKGAMKTILRDRPHIFVEAATAGEMYEIDEYLGDMGYTKLCRWAATPVYHFCYKPSKRLLVAVRRAELCRSVKTAIIRLTAKNRK
jgi:FkbM family methyltransferase